MPTYEQIVKDFEAEVAIEAGLINKDAKGSLTRSLGRLLIKLRDRRFTRADGTRVRIIQNGSQDRSLLYMVRPVAVPGEAAVDE